jgi:5S rRNA maturation endonuclease (ribonuclease M5)
MSVAEQVDFASLMEPVAARLLGEPNPRLSKPPKDIRYGNRGSLAIDLSNGCFFDHENGCGGGVIDLVASQLNCDRDTAIGWLRREGFILEPQQASASSIVATYDYRDENRVLLFQVCRFEPKDFRPLRPDGKFTLEGVRRVLYRLPDVIKAVAEGSTIYLVEGEKDADNLRKLGATATTNAGGANKWRHEYSDTLRGAYVVLLPDNDEPGRKHVEQVAAALTGIAKRVRVLDIAQHWPECPPKGDISDWIAAGATADRLAAIVEGLSDWSTNSHNSQFADAPWPVMEPEAFYGLAGKVVETIAPHSEADPNGILLQFVVAFGNALGASPHCLVEGDQHRAKLFVITSGATSKGRKGTSLGRIRQLMALADPGWATGNINSGLSSGEGVIYAVRDAVEKVGKDGAIETVDPGVSDKRLMIVSEEFVSALSAMDRAGNTLSPVLRDAWGTARLQTLIKNSPDKATGSHISIIAHTTDDELRAKLTRIEMGNGFANRFLFAKVRRSKMLPYGGHLDDQALKPLGREVAAALEKARTIGRLTMTDAAADEWEAVYPALSADRPGLLGAILGRAEAQVIRLGVIYAALDNTTQIDTPHLEAALAVWDFCEQSATQIFGDLVGDDVADTILQALRAASPNGINRTEISGLFSRHVSSSRLSLSLDLLRRLGRARVGVTLSNRHKIETWFAVEGAS